MLWEKGWDNERKTMRRPRRAGPSLAGLQGDEMFTPAPHLAA